MKVYNRNISVIGMVISVLLFIISLVFLKKIQFISDSVLLGGAFSMIYSVTRGMMSENSKVQFLTVTVGLIVALIVGSVKFVKNDESIKKSA